ncbi:MAG: hypothetical protein H0W50_10510 [Parachlamydiaceae bacterium]|nr:hypothetical protein [Parachlamydiaceae bacterium]
MFDITHDKFSVHEKKIKELQMRSDEQEAHFENLLEEHQVSKESLLLFLANPDNFEADTWKKMQHLRVEVEKEDQIKIQVRDPNKIKQKYEALENANKWILVR